MFMRMFPTLSLTKLIKRKNKMYQLENKHRQENLKVKYGTSYCVFDLVEREQTQQLNLPFSINGNFPYFEDQCGRTDEKYIIIVGVYEDRSFAVKVKEEDVEFDYCRRRVIKNLPTNIDEATSYFQEQIKRVKSYV